jgi:hypothetical protein
MRDTGIQDRLLQQQATSKEPNEEQSNKDVSMVTLAPILAVLSGGYIIGIFVLLIERCAYGNI